MIEIRIHGRGGQGGVTLAKLLATALTVFLAVSVVYLVLLSDARKRPYLMILAGLMSGVLSEMALGWLR